MGGGDHQMDIQTILIVDDSKPLVQLLIEHFVKQHKYVVKACYNGKEALEILEKDHIDLILLDVNMPVMDGLQFLAELHNRKIWLPVIIMTGEKIDVSERWFGEFGIVDYLNKPVEFTVLEEKITEILSTRTNRDFISGISLMSILQILEMERKTGILTLKLGAKDGKIFFKEGKMADIEVGNLSIDQALEECIKSEVEKNQIQIEYINHRRENRINKSLTEMLLEAARLWDEKNKPQN